MKNRKIITIFLATMLIMSCETNYRMVTVLERNGQANREVYASGDSTFLAGNISKNPFLFEITPDWNITPLDTIIEHDFWGSEQKLNVKVGKHANSIEQYSKEIRCSENNLSLASPDESLSKKFRWFYTNFSFKATYKQLKYEVPISIENYLSKEEQILFTQGNVSDYKSFNGVEINKCLNEINEKFIKWYKHNCFEISLECIKKFTTNYILDSDTDKIYKNISNAEQIDPQILCVALDSFYVTTYFSEIYNNNEQILNECFESSVSVAEQTTNNISYELVIPGKLIETNAPAINSDTLIWKVDGMRLLFENYTLTAEYRVVNTWAFILSGLILIVLIGSIISVFTRRKH